MDRGEGPQWVRIFSQWDPVVRYDIRAVEESIVELFITIDNALSTWRCDGTDWTHLRDYKQTIEGPFIVTRDGRFIITEVAGQWSLIGPLDEPGSRVVNIVAKNADEPLILVEDDAQTAKYFWLRDKLMDDTGQIVHTVSASATNFDDRFRDVVAFVVSRRPSP